MEGVQQEEHKAKIALVITAFIVTTTGFYEDDVFPLTILLTSKVLVLEKKRKCILVTQVNKTNN